MSTLQERFRKMLSETKTEFHLYIEEAGLIAQLRDDTGGIRGLGKGKRQISGLEEAYVVKDDIEYGAGHVVPLWHFGLCY